MDSKLLNPLIHVGYHKTGSTWLQKHLFDDEDIGFSRLAGKKVSQNHIGLRPATRFSRKFVFEPGGSLYALNEFSSDHMRQLLSECKVPGRGILSVLSDERLSGQPETGGFDSQKICKRLSQVFDSPKIFIVIREQKKLIASCYMDFLLKGGTLSLSEYITPSHNRSPKFKKSYFMFHHLISMYQDIFGKENVLILPYEMFREEPNLFFKSLGRFSGVDIPDSLPVKDKVNAKANTFLESKLRYLNWITMEGSPYGAHSFYMGKFIHKLGRSLKKRLSNIVPDSMEKNERDAQSNVIDDLIGDLYRESNLKTAELTGLNLEKYGYYLPSSQASEV